MRLSTVLQHLYDNIVSLGEDLLGLFYPRVCAGCDAHLRKNEHNLCLICLHDLPLTYFWDYDVAPVEELFWGRLPVASACSFLHFEQDNKTQALMHRLKYDGRTGIGIELGKAFAFKLQEKGWFSDLDMIIPLPLHATRQVRRGYNQSTYIAEGIGEVYQKPVKSHVLKRMVASDSQTNKSRFERSENVERIFKANAKELRGKNVLLVDDVVTTCATLVSAGSQLIEAGVNKLYIATLAVA
jgi:ComF family protein